MKIKSGNYSTLMLAVYSMQEKGYTIVNGPKINILGIWKVKLKKSKNYGL